MEMNMERETYILYTSQCTTVAQDDANIGENEHCVKMRMARERKGHLEINTDAIRGVKESD